MENEVETKEPGEENDVAGPEPVQTPALRLPLALTLASLLIWFGFQTVELVSERNSLVAVKSQFDAAVQQAEEMRAQLEALITKTTELARQGNRNAQIAIEELQKRGVPIS